MALCTEASDSLPASSLRRRVVQRMGASTSMRRICQRMAGFHKIDSNIARAADGVMTS